MKSEWQDRASPRKPGTQHPGKRENKCQGPEQAWTQCVQRNRRSLRLELGLKEQTEARGAGGSHARGFQGLQRSLDLIPSAREPLAGGFSLCCPCLAGGQHLHSGARGSLLLLIGKTLIFWILESQGLVYHCRTKKTASLIKGSKQRGSASLWGTFSPSTREGQVHFAHPSKRGASQEIPSLPKESVPGMKANRTENHIKEPRAYWTTNSGHCWGGKGEASLCLLPLSLNLVLPLTFCFENTSLLWASLSCNDIISPWGLAVCITRALRTELPAWCLLSSKCHRWQLPSLLLARDVTWILGAVEHSVHAQAHSRLQTFRRFHLFSITWFASGGRIMNLSLCCLQVQTCLPVHFPVWEAPDLWGGRGIFRLRECLPH